MLCIIPMSAIPKCRHQSQLKVVGGSCKWSLIVIVLSGFLPTQSCHIHSLLSVPPLFPRVNNKSYVTSQITQTAYHLFIVVYHNNSLCTQKPQQVRHRLLLMNLEDHQIWKLSDSGAVYFSPLVCTAYLYTTSDIWLWDSFICGGFLSFCSVWLHCC